MDIKTYLGKLNYQPIGTLPWIEENMSTADFDEEDPNIYRYMPCGVVLMDKYRRACIIGDNVYGRNTTGCNCCSQKWQDIIDIYTHWAWIWDVKK